MALNTTGLAEAYARQQKNTANAADIANLNYATSKGWKPTPQPPAGSVAIPGAQYNTKELQQANFTNIQPVGGTLYGTPKVPMPNVDKPLATAGLTNLPNQLSGAKAQNQLLQSQQGLYNQEQVSSSLNNLVGQIKAAEQDYTSSISDLSTISPIQQELASQQKAIKDYQLGTTQQVSAQDFNPNLLTSQVGKSQMQIERERQFGLQSMQNQEANLLTKLGLAQEARNAALEAKKTGVQSLFQNVDLLNQAQARIDQQKQQAFANTQALSAQAKDSLAMILSGLRGVDPNKLSAQQTTQLVSLANQAGIPSEVLLQGMEVLKDSMDFEQLLASSELAMKQRSLSSDMSQQGLTTDYKNFQLAGGESGTGKTFEQWLTQGTAQGGQLNDVQRKSVLYAQRMAEADNIIKSLEEFGSQIIGTVTQYAPNVFKSEERQMMEQAQRNFVNAVLRQESGAAIAPSEFDSAIKQYFPQPGDTQKVIDQKRANRQTAIEGMTAGINTNQTNTTTTTTTTGGGEWGW